MMSSSASPTPKTLARNATLAEFIHLEEKVRSLRRHVLLEVGDHPLGDLFAAKDEIEETRKLLDRLERAVRHEDDLDTAP